MRLFYVYILECTDKSYYVGITNDVMLRIVQHNSGSDKKAYTFSRRPVLLKWYQEFTTPEEAISKEKQIKEWSRKKKEALINNDFDNLVLLSRNSLRQAQADSGIEDGKENLKTSFDKLRMTSRANKGNRFNNIIEKLPYTKPFLFVDKLHHIDENGAEGSYTFHGDLDFYLGHFDSHPITPGVILTECCAQIGLVCLGLFILGNDPTGLKIALSSSEMEFYLPVYPNETVKVISKKMYFRFHKLKCEVKMHNAKGELVCKGIIAGMLKSNTDE